MQQVEGLPKYCSCEEVDHGSVGPVGDSERLARVLHEDHFNRKGELKPSAFPLKQLSDIGLSLVRVDLIDAAELEAVANDILRLSGRKSQKGALVGAASKLRALCEQDGARKLCVKDDPVRGERVVRDNPAHAITICTKHIEEPDVREIRESLLRIFNEVSNLKAIYAIAPVA